MRALRTPAWRGCAVLSPQGFLVLGKRRVSAIQHDARELDVQYVLGHSSPDMVRRYSSTYRSEQAEQRHAAFSPADQMLPVPAPSRPVDECDRTSTASHVGHQRTFARRQ